MDLQEQLSNNYDPTINEQHKDINSSKQSENSLNSEQLADLSIGQIDDKESEQHEDSLDIIQSQISQESQKKKIRSRSKSKEKENTFCCTSCTKHDKNQGKNRSCVCVVPAFQRKIKIGPEGCKTCGCHGCTKEDKEKREYETKIRMKDQERKKQMKEKGIEILQNGCCKKCMKAFSKSGKSCLCQVPNKDRKKPLPPDGCVICGCFGCNPIDLNPNHHHEQSRSDRHNDRRQDNKKKDSYNDDESVYVDFKKYNFFNIENSNMGHFINDQLAILPSLIGFGIPERSDTYIFGKKCKDSKY